MPASAPPAAASPANPGARSPVDALWDIFCRVIDNFGDIGVCWRLACQLADRGRHVRLWIDDPSALRWMAPDGHPGVDVATWQASTTFAPPGDVVIEAFGCDPPPAFLAAMASMGATGAAGAAGAAGARGDLAQPATGSAVRPPVWINLEYLSAESYVERSHGLASPQMSGPARGLTKWFFYPGFNAATGGLLRETALMGEQAAFDRHAWLRECGIVLRQGERLVSVFCYPGAPIGRLLASLRADGVPTLLATAPGAATGATRAALEAPETLETLETLEPPEALEAQAAPTAGSSPAPNLAAPAGEAGLLRQHALPWLPQADFDRLLWSADLNIVRGEDSWVRAQWAGKPFVWQAYRQDDGAHGAKIEAFLATMLQGAPAAAADFIRRWTLTWNDLDPAAEPPPGCTADSLATAAIATTAWRTRLLASPDLVTKLLAFVAEKR